VPPDETLWKVLTSFAGVVILALATAIKTLFSKLEANRSEDIAARAALWERQTSTNESVAKALTELSTGVRALAEGLRK